MGFARSAFAPKEQEVSQTKTCVDQGANGDYPAYGRCAAAVEKRGQARHQCWDAEVQPEEHGAGDSTDSQVLPMATLGAFGLRVDQPFAADGK